MEKINQLESSSLSRRNFLAGVGALGAANALAGCDSTNTSIVPLATTAAVTDVDILNFALNLEYLEAEFYLRAATGSGLATADIGSNPGAVTGGAQITGFSSLPTAQQNIINEIAYDEQAHVRALRATITAAGGTPVARPAIDLTNSFNTLASTAGIASTFKPFGGFDAFITGAFIFEDVGVTAYSGAAPLISTAGIAAGYLAAAAGILAVEAYHAAYVRTYLTAQAIANSSYVYLGYANKISALRSTLGSGMETTLTVPTGTTSATSIVTPSGIVAATSANAIAYARTTDQVLHIVYGTLSNTAGATISAAGVAKGGFFPNGLNGNITITAS